MSIKQNAIPISALLLAGCAMALPFLLPDPKPQPDPALTTELAAMKLLVSEKVDDLDSRLGQLNGDLNKQLAELTQQIESLQQQATKAGADDERIAQLSNDLRNLTMDVNALSQRIAQPQQRSAAAQKAAIKRPAPKPTSPSFRLENIDQFGGKTYAVVNVAGERKFLASNDELDGWRLDALSGSSARFVHLDSGANATLAPQ